MTRHFRNGEELREVNRDDYYSHHFQEIRSLHYRPQVLPVRTSVDSILTTILYDNSLFLGRCTYHHLLLRHPWL